MSDLISRTDAIDAVRGLSVLVDDKDFSYFEDALKALPSADAVSREFYNDAVKANIRIVMENSELKEQIESADAVQGYTKWLEDIIIKAETLEWLCEDTNDKEWCEKNCHYSSIQAECLRHLYEVSKGGAV